MSGFLASRLLLLMGECLAAAALIPLLAMLAAACFPKHAAMRHLVWLASFAALLALPLVVALVPSRFVIEQASAPAAIATRDVAPAMTMTDAAPAPSHLLAPTAAVAMTVSYALHAFDPAPLLAGGLVLWLTGILSILLHHALALLGFRRLRLASVAHALDLPEPDTRCELRLATLPNAHGPMTWGILRPVILLPQDALSWPRERLGAVLRHEIAHVRRHDTLTQTLAHLACGLYWPNPLVWLAARRMRREAEIAADDAVIAAGIKPSSYAEALLALAAEFRGGNPGLAMAAPSALAARVQSVLTPNQSRTGVTSMDACKITSLGICALAIFAVARPDLAVAQAPLPAVAPAMSAQQPASPITQVLPALATPPSKVRVGPVPTSKPDTAQIRAQLQAQAEKIKAQTDAIKAKGDVLAEQALQKAEMKKDTVKRAKDLTDAAAVRSKADVLKVQADRLAARALTLAANDTPPSSHEVTTETENGTTLNGVTTFTRSGNGKTETQTFSNPEQAASAKEEALQAAQAQSRAVADALAQVRPEIDKALASARMDEATQKVLAAHIKEIVAQALAEARPRIEAAVAQAKAAAIAAQKSSTP